MSQTSHKLDNDFFFTEGKIEVRSAEGGGGERVFGYYAVYNQRSRLLRDKDGKRFYEVILPGAFRSTDFSDMAVDFEHELFLAAPPTLRYGTDETGAWYEYDHDPTDPDHCRMLPKIKRGDIKGSSFEFSVRKGDYTFEKEGDVVVRHVHTIPYVRRGGPVANPAYPGTSTVVRSYQEFQAEELETQAETEKRAIIERRKKEVRAFL